MTLDEFWSIIEETHSLRMAENERRLLDRLYALSEQEILAFDRLWLQRFFELYTWPLWAVAILVQDWCSDDGFMDWRNWIISCGRAAFETALLRPDDLAPLIDSEPDAGCEGIAYVRIQALQAKNPAWKNASPVHEDLVRPENPAGSKWKSEEDAQAMLPKIYARYVQNITQEEKDRKDPEKLIEKHQVRIGPPQAFRPSVEQLEIGGQKAQRLTLAPIKKRPWWKFWR